MLPSCRLLLNYIVATGGGVRCNCSRGRETREAQLIMSIMCCFSPSEREGRDRDQRRAGRGHSSEHSIAIDSSIYNKSCVDASIQGDMEMTVRGGRGYAARHSSSVVTESISNEVSWHGGSAALAALHSSATAIRDPPGAGSSARQVVEPPLSSNMGAGLVARQSSFLESSPRVTLRGFQVSTSPISMVRLGGSCRHDSRDMEQMFTEDQLKVIGGSAHDGSLFSGHVVLSGASGVLSRGSLISSSEINASAPAKRQVSMLSKQIGVSLRKISSHLKRISSSARVPPSEDSGSAHKEDSSQRSKPQVRRLSSAILADTSCSKRGCGLIAANGADSENAVAFLQPTAPLWLPGLDYEVYSPSERNTEVPKPPCYSQAPSERSKSPALSERQSGNASGARLSHHQERCDSPKIVEEYEYAPAVDAAAAAMTSAPQNL